MRVYALNVLMILTNFNCFMEQTQIDIVSLKLK